MTAIALVVLNNETTELEEYPALVKGKEGKKWHKAYGNDLCCLAQGMPWQKHGTDKGTNTIKFIPRSAVPAHKKIIHGKKSAQSNQTKKRSTVYVSPLEVINSHAQET